MTQLALTSQPTALAIRYEPTPDQEQMVRDTFLSGASANEAKVLLEVAKQRNLNPLLRQIHFVKRWDGGKKREVWSTQISIDGMRAVAQRTGLYAGQDEVEFQDDEKGTPKVAKVKVYRKDWDRPVVGRADWNEYVQTTKEGNPTSFWKRMPRVMLAKCAEAAGLRKAFPEDLSGLYISEEMQGPAVKADGSQEVIDAEVVDISPAPAVANVAPSAGDVIRAAMLTPTQRKEKALKVFADDLGLTQDELRPTLGDIFGRAFPVGQPITLKSMGELEKLEKYVEESLKDGAEFFAAAAAVHKEALAASQTKEEVKQ